MIRSTTIALMLLTMTGPAMAAEKDLSTLLTLEAAPTAVVVPVSAMRFDVTRRPVALPALYVTFAALQIADARSTFGAVGRGAQETNPLMGRGNQATLWAVKAATAASTIYFTERLWKKNRVAAILVMAAVNGSSAAIVAHNMKQAR
jgi:hypothetical protein